MDMIKWLASHAANLISGLITAIIGYFAPVSGVISVMVAAIIIDMIFGIIAARKRGEGIKSEGLWRTAKKLFYAVVIVALLFAVDTEIYLIESHRFVAWVIIGFEAWSMLENAAYITDHPVFKALQKYMQDKTEELTGIDISHKEHPHENHT